MTIDLEFTAELLGTLIRRDFYYKARRSQGGSLEPDSLAAHMLEVLNQDIDRLTDMIDIEAFY